MAEEVQEVPERVNVGLKVPHFLGKENRAEVQSYLTRIESAVDSAGYSGADKAKEAAGMLSNSLRGRALNWYTVLQSEEPGICRDYAQLLARFKERYLMPVNAQELHRMKETLKMADDENVFDFLDRCKVAQVMEVGEQTAATKATAFYKESFNKGVTSKFMEGLKEDIMQAVQAQGATCTSLDDHVKVARSVELSLAKKKLEKKVAETAKDNKVKDAKDTSVDEVKRQGGQQRGGGYRGQGGRGRGRGRGNINPNIRCFNCNNIGHPQRLCPQGGQGQGQGGNNRGGGWNNRGGYQNRGGGYQNRGSGYQGGYQQAAITQQPTQQSGGNVASVEQQGQGQWQTPGWFQEDF